MQLSVCKVAVRSDQPKECYDRGTNQSLILKDAIAAGLSVCSPPQQNPRMPVGFAVLVPGKGMERLQERPGGRSPMQVNTNSPLFGIEMCFGVV